jgi:hypothetical protein
MSAPPLKVNVRNCLNKRRYSDEFAARAAAQASIKRHGNAQALWVYQCTECRGWHLTHKNQKTRRTMVTSMELVCRGVSA